MRSAHLHHRRLTAAWRFFIVAHVAALVTMAVWLEPGLRPSATVVERASYVANHPWRWTLGWLPWQLCALSNLLVSWSLVVWLRSRPGRAGLGWAILAMVLTVVAVIPEQWAELFLVTDYIGLAKRSGTDLGLRAFAEKERWVLIMTGPCANSSYVAMTLAWVFALTRAARGAVDARAMTWLGVLLCIPFAGASVVIHQATRTLELSGMERSIPFNAVGFPLLVLWSLMVAVLLRRLHRFDHPHADETLHRLQPWWLAWLCDLRDQLRVLPTFELSSDVRDVVYLSWLVPCARAERLLPPGLELDRFGDHTVLSILTYTHGGFGPSALGPLRRLLPSPHQSNWRLYVKPRGDVYFVKSVLSSLIYTLGSRLMAEGLPAHHAPRFEHGRKGNTVVSVIEGGGTNAPDLNASVEIRDDRKLPSAWQDAFESWDAAVYYLVEQNRGVAPHPTIDATIASNIDIPIPIAEAQPAHGEASSTWLEAVVADCELFCFVVPRVPFRALGEESLAPSPGRHAGVEVRSSSRALRCAPRSR